MRLWQENDEDDDGSSLGEAVSDSGLCDDADVSSSDNDELDPPASKKGTAPNKSATRGVIEDDDDDDDDMASSSSEGWQFCFLCNSSSDNVESRLILCQDCDVGVHIGCGCLLPSLAEPGSQPWYCAHCQYTRDRPGIPHPVCSVCTARHDFDCIDKTGNMHLYKEDNRWAHRVCRHTCRVCNKPNDEWAELQVDGADGSWVHMECLASLSTQDSLGDENGTSRTRDSFGKDCEEDEKVPADTTKDMSTGDVNAFALEDDEQSGAEEIDLERIMKNAEDLMLVLGEVVASDEIDYDELEDYLLMVSPEKGAAPPHYQNWTNENLGWALDHLDNIDAIRVEYLEEHDRILIRILNTGDISESANTAKSDRSDNDEDLGS